MIGEYSPLVAIIKRRTLSYSGHVCRHNNLSKTSMQGKVDGISDRGRLHKYCMTNITQWTGKNIDELLNKLKDIDGWVLFIIVAREMIHPTMHASRD